MIKFELKKIFNIKIVLVIFVLTALFYNMFLSTNYFATSNMGAEDKLCTILMKEYGTKLPVSKRNKLEEIKQEYIEKVDKYIAGDEVLKNAGITNYKDYKSMRSEEGLDDKVKEKLDDISFGSYAEETFLIQEVDYWQEWETRLQFAGLSRENAESNITENVRRHTGEVNKLNPKFLERMEKLYTRDYTSLLSEDAAECVKSDLPLIGLLMLICSALLIIPYQIRERIRNVNTLFYTTKHGRNLVNTRITATVITTVLVGIAHIIIFYVYLIIRGVGKYLDCPIYCTARVNSWYDLNFGTYICLNLLLYIFAIMSLIMLYFLISKISLNYVVGFASAIPFTVIIAIIFNKIMYGYLIIENKMKITYDVYRPILICISFTIIGLIIAVALAKYEKKKDVVIC